MGPMGRVRGMSPRSSKPKSKLLSHHAGLAADVLATACRIWSAGRSPDNMNPDGRTDNQEGNFMLYAGTRQLSKPQGLEWKHLSPQYWGPLQLKRHLRLTVLAAGPLQLKRQKPKPRDEGPGSLMACASLRGAQRLWTRPGRGYGLQGFRVSACCGVSGAEQLGI